MLATKIIICISTLVILLISRRIYKANYETMRMRDILVIIATLLGSIFCALLIITSRNVFTLPKILLFISVCLYILFKEKFNVCVPFWKGIAVTVVIFSVTVIIYVDNLEKCEVPEISITSTTVICAKDNDSITGSISGNIWYVPESGKEEAIYKYYYQLEDGGIKQGNIPADSTTIYFLKSGEKAHLETIVTTEYWVNYNNSPSTRCFETSEITYKLYVPENSVIDTE